METLNNAPITEAVFDLRVGFEKPPSIQDLEKIYDEIKVEFPSKVMKSLFEAKFTKQDAGISEDPHGFLFKTGDGKKIVQSRKDGFTFNKLYPYDTWESFRDEAWKYWKLFCSLTPPSKITRLALRYVNKFEIPKPVNSIDDYLTTAPKIDGGIQQNTNAFFMRLEFEGVENNCNAIVTSAIDQTKQSKDNLTILFDIDVYKILGKETTESEIQENFEILHDFKNEIFFRSMKEKAIELFS